MDAELFSDPSPPRWNRYRSRKRENSSALLGRCAALAKLIVAGLSGPPRLVASLSGLESRLLTVEEVELSLPSRRKCPRPARAVESETSDPAGEIMPSLPSMGDSGTLGGGLRNERRECIGGEGAGESSGVVNGDMWPGCTKTPCCCRKLGGTSCAYELP